MYFFIWQGRKNSEDTSNSFFFGVVDYWSKFGEDLQEVVPKLNGVGLIFGPYFLLLVEYYFVLTQPASSRSVSCRTTIYRETCDNKISETCGCHRKCRLQKQYSPPMMNAMYLLHTTQIHLHLRHVLLYINFMKNTALNLPGKGFDFWGSKEHFSYKSKDGNRRQQITRKFCIYSVDTILLVQHSTMLDVLCLSLSS